MTQNLDSIVDEITARVTQRLAGLGAIPQSKVKPMDICKGPCSNSGRCHTRRRGTIETMKSLGAARFSNTVSGDQQINKEVAGMIDHTLLAPEATRDQLLKICKEAREYSFATVCVNASNISVVAKQLAGSSVKPIAVVGFPLGAATSQAKAFETREAVRNGALEIDMVINIGAIKSKDYGLVHADIKAVVDAARPHPVKVILETASLDREEKVVACALSKTAGAAFVKTSTGFGKGGATVEDIALMRKVVGKDMEVKASGGVRTAEDADKFIKAGADRIGASASIAIVTGQKAKSGNY